MSSIQIPPLFIFFLLFFSSISGLPNPDPAAIQPFHPTTTTSSSSSSPPATIPAFPEQSDIAACPLDLPDQFFHSIKTACGSTKDGGAGGKLRRTRCCPVLAAWLYSAYSETALGISRVGKVAPAVAGHNTTSYDMPLLPDDSETCVADLDKALQAKGIELARPNETCDVVYCYCGIRLHPLSCQEAFSLNPNGKLVGDERVKRLEKDCLSSSNNVNGFPGLGGCSKCLNSLRLLNSKKALNTSKIEDRTTKMHNKDCQLMGLTWLLAKNRTAYIHTVSAVLRAIMLSTDGSTPRSCTLSSDGMPLAVDSTEIPDPSSSTTLGAPISLSIGSVFFVVYALHIMVIPKLVRL
ncbi:hypothetical protein FEM48_Zijuj05G0089500 [Ziziphus jujuba var. spinosa]|uniref:SPARK domain-containing protein n=1 Tax=Ziziphus jujuba var. spinosa TaxID=714518 RepID=A0A978VE14_ZIZJJ|nr:hypothetical protein FEM48_Zijuj05G0089500 [Ziziphus jujuba var. spinosa]